MGAEQTSMRQALYFRFPPLAALYVKPGIRPVMTATRHSLCVLVPGRLGCN